MPIYDRNQAAAGAVVLKGGGWPRPHFARFGRKRAWLDFSGPTASSFLRCPKNLAVCCRPLDATDTRRRRCLGSNPRQHRALQADFESRFFKPPTCGAPRRRRPSTLPISPRSWPTARPATRMARHRLLPASTTPSVLMPRRTKRCCISFTELLPAILPMRVCPQALSRRCPNESVAKLRDWIAAGALDKDLQTTLSDQDVKEILDD